MVRQWNAPCRDGHDLQHAAATAYTIARATTFYLAELRPFAMPLWLLLNVRKEQPHFYLGLTFKPCGSLRNGPELPRTCLRPLRWQARSWVGAGGGAGAGAVNGGREGLEKVAESYQNNAENRGREGLP